MARLTVSTILYKLLKSLSCNDFSLVALCVPVPPGENLTNHVIHSNFHNSRITRRVNKVKIHREGLSQCFLERIQLMNLNIFAVLAEMTYPVNDESDSSTGFHFVENVNVKKS